MKNATATTRHPAVQETTIQILVHLSHEDGVWNANALDLPIAVFGETLDQAKQHFREAFHAHMQALQQLGKLDAVVDQLLAAQQDCQALSRKLQNAEIFIKYEAHLQDRELALT